MVLVDTSVWIEHFRRGSPKLKDLLHDEQVLGHSLIVGELACGNIKNRDEILSLLQALPQATEAENHEVLLVLEKKKLFGKGLSWIDICLLISVLISGSALWTLDKRLQKIARSLDLPPTP